MFRTGNPALNNQAYKPAQKWGEVAGRDDMDGISYVGESTNTAARAKHMTVLGTVQKSSLLLAICCTLAVLAWNLSLDGTQLTGSAMALTFGGMLAGIVLALITIFKPKASPITAPLYAGAEGLFVGGISALFATWLAPEADELNSGLVFNAILLTFGIFGSLLACYAFRIVRPNKLFYNIVIVGTLGVCLYGLLAFVLGYTGVTDSLRSVYDPNNGGMISIGFSLLLLGLASANLVLDFDLVNNGVQSRAPKYMEWYSGFALLVTLVWLYIEALRLLAKLQSRE